MLEGNALSPAFSIIPLLPFFSLLLFLVLLVVFTLSVDFLRSRERLVIF